MPEFRTRSRSVSIPSSSTSSFSTFQGDSQSRSGSSEQVSFPSAHTTHDGSRTINGGPSSHWKALSSHFRPSRARSIAVHSPYTPEALQTPDTPERRQRTIVRKSLRISESSLGNLQKPLPPRPKLEEIDSDDEGTLVSVSGVEISPQDYEAKEKNVVADMARPEKRALGVSNKILTIIPDIFEDEDSEPEPSSKQDVTVPYTGKSLHWGLRSSPYHPEFVIEKEDEKEVQAPTTSLSPPPNFRRRHSTATAPRR